MKQHYHVFCAFSAFLLIALAEDGTRADSVQSTPANTLNTTTLPDGTSTKVVTVPATTESIKAVTSGDILGCGWPKDYAARVDFCLKKTNLTLFAPDSGYSPVKYGLLDPNYVNVVEKSCIKGSICPGQYDKKKLSEFTQYWKKNAIKIRAFETCLRRNTEGIVKMCGTTSQVGKIISGAAGLHLNLIGALSKLKDADDACFLKASEAAHLTAALYMHEDAYQQNNVICWDAKNTKTGCTADCAKRNTTFVEKVKQKWHEISTDVEHALHLPIMAVLAIVAGALLLIAILTTVLCMYVHGTLFKRRRTLRYSSLINEGKADEMRKLADNDDDDD